MQNVVEFFVFPSFVFVFHCDRICNQQLVRFLNWTNCVSPDVALVCCSEEIMLQRFNLYDSQHWSYYLHWWIHDRPPKFGYVFLFSGSVELGKRFQKMAPVYLWPINSLSFMPSDCLVLVLYWLNLKEYCRNPFLGQSFVSSDRGRGPLQVEDHSESRPHSFPGLYLMRSGRTPEWFRSVAVVAGS